MGKTVELVPPLMDEVMIYVCRLGFVSCSDLQQKYRIKFSAATSLKERLLRKMDLLSIERLPGVSYRLVNAEISPNINLKTEIAIAEVTVSYLTWNSSALLVVSPQYANLTAKEYLRTLSQSWAAETSVGLSYFDFCRFIGGCHDKPNRIIRVMDFQVEGEERVANLQRKLAAATALSEHFQGAQSALVLIHADFNDLQGSELKEIAREVSSILKTSGRIYLSLVHGNALPAKDLHINIFLSFESN